jgi:hypothetical protein
MEAAWNRGDFRGYMAGFKNPDVVFTAARAPDRLGGQGLQRPSFWDDPEH